MKIEKTIAIYLGSFDPITNGHIDIIKRATKLFDDIIVLVANNRNNNPMFSTDFRISMIREAIIDIEGVLSVEPWDGLIVDYVRRMDACVIIRGLRAVTDFEYEFQMALTNKTLYSPVETLFIPTSAENMYLSSSMVKQIAQLGGDVSKFVPPCVERSLKLAQPQENSCPCPARSPHSHAISL